MSHPAMISGSPTAQPGQHFVVREKGGKINFSCVQDNLSSVDISVANMEVVSKKFSCGHCDKKFTQSSNLQTHERIPTGEKAFSCSREVYIHYKCKGFKDLRAHNRIHTGVKSFSCLFCKYKCNDSSHLKAH